MQRVRLTINPFLTVAQLLQQAIEKSGAKGSSSEFLLLLRTQTEGLFNQIFTPTQDEYYYYGHLLKPDQQLYHYFNQFDGLKNVFLSNLKNFFW